MYTLQTVVDAIKAEHPELSTNMAQAIAMLAMNDFRIKFAEDDACEGNNVQRTYRVDNSH